LLEWRFSCAGNNQFAGGQLEDKMVYSARTGERLIDDKVIPLIIEV